MNVKELQGLIETLKKRIRDHRNDLMASEALTRYALVDPLLRELGWDTGDPGQVRPEYTLREGEKYGEADYALFKNDQDKTVARKDGQKVPAVVVEAKRLGMFGKQDNQDQVSLDGLVGLERVLAGAEQAMRYCNTDGIRYFAVTDGQFWHLFQTNKDGNLSEKKINSFVLTEEWALADCLSAVELWRCNPNPPGTKRVVDGGIPLDGDGYELTLTGKRRQKQGKDLPRYPSGAMRRLDGTCFLSREGFVLNSDGKHPLDTKQVGGNKECRRVEEPKRRGQLLF